MTNSESEQENKVNQEQVNEQDSLKEKKDYKKTGKERIDERERKTHKKR